MFNERVGDWIQSASGLQVYPLDPRPEEIRIGDIAHALSHVCRFAGHSRFFYSVAQHSVLASLAATPASALPALLHDAAEAYMGDIARPWKRFLYVRVPGRGTEFIAPLKSMEHELLAVILSALGCPPETDPVWEPVAEIDMRLLATEARDLMSPMHDEWSNTFKKSPCEARYAYNPYPDEIEEWAPRTAKAIFLDRYAKLTRR